MRRREARRLDLAPDMERRQDVEQRKPFDAARMIERQAIADARAAVVPDNGEAHMAELLP